MLRSYQYEQPGRANSGANRLTAQYGRMETEDATAADVSATAVAGSVLG